MELFTTFLSWLNPLELVKKYMERKKQTKKLMIYKALEQTGVTPPSLTVEQISGRIRLPVEELEPLLYDMIREGTIKEGEFPSTYTRYHN